MLQHDTADAVETKVCSKQLKDIIINVMISLSVHDFNPLHSKILYLNCMLVNIPSTISNKTAFLHNSNSNKRTWL